MALEIERRFLVDISKAPVKDMTGLTRIVQTYISKPEDSTMTRIRACGKMENSWEYFITIKKQIAKGVCKEFEDHIDFKMYHDLFREYGEFTLYKTRMNYFFGGLTFEIDTFAKDPWGEMNLVIAEVEIPHIDQPFIIPNFLTKDITFEKGISNFDMVFNKEKAIETFSRLMV